jgi:hypothetical protein
MSEDEFTKLFKYMEKRFDGMEKRFDENAHDHANIRADIAELGGRSEIIMPNF